MKIPISDIAIGERRREDMGDLQSLADSINAWGLLHPIVIDDQKRLVAGERRLRACQSLGWKEIEVKMLSQLTEDDLREIELEENLRRKDLTEYERSKDMVYKAKKIAPIISSKLDQKDPRGRKPQMEAPKDDIAKAIGTSKAELIRAEQHVTTAETYPFMQKPEWKQYHVLEAREAMEKIPEDERPVVAAMVGEPAIPPKVAIELIRNVGNMKPQERQEVCQLYQSNDLRDRSLAKTKAAQLPPEPDPRLFPISDAIQSLQKCIRLFPGDPLTPRIKTLIQELEDLKKEIRGVSRREPTGTDH